MNTAASRACRLGAGDYRTIVGRVRFGGVLQLLQIRVELLKLSNTVSNFDALSRDELPEAGTRLMAAANVFQDFAKVVES